MNTNAVIDHITNWLKSYCERAGQKGFVVGVSGGIDSAVTSALCARTGLPTLCVEMPIHQAQSQVTRALEHVATLQRMHHNVSLERIDLTPAFDTLEQALPDSPNADAHQLALANTRARLRMTTLYYLAGINGLLVAGTGNKVEDFGVGFFTKYGDGGADLVPLAGLSKGQGRELLRALGAPEHLIAKVPTADLLDGAPGQTDEANLGVSYEHIDAFLEGRALPEHVSAKLVEGYLRSAHKRHTPTAMTDTWWRQAE